MTRQAPALDVLVVGAGQVGLALGYHLSTTPLRFQRVDRHARVGDSWRRRYDSLVLFTPRGYSALLGLPVEETGQPDGSCPIRDRRRSERSDGDGHRWPSTSNRRAAASTMPVTRPWPC